MSEIMLKDASYESKTSFKLPEGASIIKKDVRINVKEIENGFVICKNYDITYQNIEGDKDYAYYTKEWFSKTNPISIDIEEEEEEESLADKID